ncbi:MAG: DUF115 domain-containing protein [Synergistaceae bacterium]|jgi:hypothetical protein|nr:DUF115 domain-containing protein [Synergistaceae bacterium]
MAKELCYAQDGDLVWNKNMAALRGLQPTLARLLDKYVEDHGRKFAHYEIKTPAGTWFEGLTDKPFFQSSGGVKFNWSKRGGEELNFFLYGIGAPPYISQAIEALPNDARIMVVVEPSLPLLAYALHVASPYSNLPKNCQIFFLFARTADAVAPNGEIQNDGPAVLNRILFEEVFRATMKSVGLYSISSFLATEHPGEAETCGQIFKDVDKKVVEWVATMLKSVGFSPEEALKGVRNIALMSPWIAFGRRLDSLGDRFKDRPFVCVAAGPSLDKNFEQLRDVQDRCVIVAADAVLEKLLRNGIRPHVVLALDKSATIYEAFFSDVLENYREDCRNILLVTHGVCVPRLGGCWPGQLCIVGKTDNILDVWLVRDILGGYGLNNTGTSVGHANYSIAAAFGASAIAIIGQDLAYASDGQSHAGGVAKAAQDNIAKLEGDPRVMKIPGALGGEVYTTVSWLSYLRLLEEYIRAAPHQRVFDCTEGGALIAGAAVKPLRAFIDEYVRDLEPMAETPAQVVASSEAVAEGNAATEMIVKRIDEDLKKLDAEAVELDSLREIVKRTRSAGLTPARRSSLAREANLLLNKLLAARPEFVTINQSYFHQMSFELDIARDRMETVEQVERWHEIYKDMMAVQISVMSAIKKWLLYMRRSVVHYWNDKFEMRPLTSEEAIGLVMRLFDEYETAEGDDLQDMMIKFDYLMARCDPTRLKWNWRIVWNLAKLLHDEERSEEARLYMARVLKVLVGQDLLRSEVLAIYGDYIRILMAHDLACRPDYDKAEIMLAGVVALCGMDESLYPLIVLIMDGVIEFYQNVRIFRKSMDRAAWLRFTARVRRNLYSAGVRASYLEITRRAVMEYCGTEPDWAASLLECLAESLAECMVAEDEKTAGVAARIADEMASDKDLPPAMRLQFLKMLCGEMTRRGVSPDAILAKSRLLEEIGVAENQV